LVYREPRLAGVCNNHAAGPEALDFHALTGMDTRYAGGIERSLAYFARAIPLLITFSLNCEDFALSSTEASTS